MTLLLGRRKFNLTLSQDYFLGILVAIPFSYPKEPLYWFGLSAFLLALPGLKIGKDATIRLVLVLLFLCMVIISNMISSYQESIQFFSIVGTFFTMSCFMFRYCLKSIDDFVSGFLLVAGIYTFLTFIAFLVLKPYQYGFDFFIESSYRMWAEGYLIEWPNVFCAFLVLGAYLNWIRCNGLLATLNILAAVLTTSRMAILAIAIFVLFLMLRPKIASKAISISLVVLVVAVVAFLVASNNEMFLDYISRRLFKTSDRAFIFNDMVTVFVDNIFGVGNISFSVINELFVSYHSSFLKVLIRYGLPGFLIFLLLIAPRNPFWNPGARENAPILFMLCIGLVQDMLLHIHLVIMYSVMLELRDAKMRTEGQRLTDKYSVEGYPRNE